MNKLRYMRLGKDLAKRLSEYCLGNFNPGCTVGTANYILEFTGARVYVGINDDGNLTIYDRLTHMEVE